MGSESPRAAGWARAPKPAQRQHPRGELSPPRAGRANTLDPFGFRSTAPETTPPLAPSSVLNLLRAWRRFRGASASPRQAKSPRALRLRLAKGQITRETGRQKSVIRAPRGHTETYWDGVGDEWEGWGELNAGKEETLATSHLPSLPT